MNIVPLFSTPLYENSLEIDNGVLNFVKTLKYTPCRQHDPYDGWMSVNNYILEVPELIKLKSSIVSEINKFLKDGLCFPDYIKFNITTSWVVKHEKGHYASNHLHKNSLFSGVVYLHVNENSGNIVFTNSGRNPLFPSEITIDVGEYNIFNMITWNVRPKTNNILIFPSHLYHHVTPNKSSEDRYALAFNIFPSGIFDGGTISELKII